MGGCLGTHKESREHADENAIMAALIQRVALQAMQTFSKQTPKAAFQEHLTQLRALLNQVTARDVDFDERLVSNSSPLTLDSDSVPTVTYLHLWEDSVFSMGIFVIRNGGRIPLHDHPSMHGLVRVIHGAVRVQSYSAREKQELPHELQARLRPWQVSMIKPVSANIEVNADVQSDACVLSPLHGNFHEIQAVNGPAAFLDILAPPYDHHHGPNARECHYYKVLNLTDETSSEEPADSSSNNDRLANSCFLIQIPQPRDFFGDGATYTGPSLDILKSTVNEEST